MRRIIASVPLSMAAFLTSGSVLLARSILFIIFLELKDKFEDFSFGSGCGDV
jgi:hypothetical protein